MLAKCSTAVILIAVITKCFVNPTHAEDEVCYDYLGCFSMLAPWSSIPRPIPPPQPPDWVNTIFDLYTRNASEMYRVTKLPAVSLEGSTFSGRKPTFVLTHGFLAHGDVTWLLDMKDALLKRVDGNVIIVNWQKGATKLNYLEVAANTRIAGAETARLIHHLIHHEEADASRLHLIGHSLGAHIMSYVAKKIPNVARLTALDPAQPGFEGFPSEVRLDRSDARYVEVIHTNAKPFFPLFGAGMMTEIGHVDFYINGGWDQPGCLIPRNIPKIQGLSELALLPVEVLASVVKCPHERSIHLFMESITNRNCLFWGQRVSVFTFTASVLGGGNLNWFLYRSSCSKDTCVPLGLESINYPARGSFLLPTSWTEPFCISEPENDSKMMPHRQLKDIVEILPDDKEVT